MSRYIKALENGLGFELFDRSANPMRLTAAGELFLPLASEAGVVLKRIDAFRAAHRGVPMNVVRVRGIADGVTLPLLHAAKVAAEEASPSTRVKFCLHQFQTSFEDVRTGDLDVAVEPLSDLVDVHDLAWFHLAYEPPRLVMEAGNPLAQRDAFGVDDLAELQFTSLRSNRDNAMRKHVQGLCKAHHLSGDLPKALVLSPADSYDALLLDGLGDYVLMLPQSLASRYADDGSGVYVSRPFGDERAAYDFCVFYRENAPSHVKRYLDELRARAC